MFRFVTPRVRALTIQVANHHNTRSVTVPPHGIVSHTNDIRSKQSKTMASRVTYLFRSLHQTLSTVHTRAPVIPRPTHQPNFDYDNTSCAEYREQWETRCDQSPPVKLQRIKELNYDKIPLGRLTHETLEFFEQLHKLSAPLRRNGGQIQELSSISEIIQAIEYNNIIGVGDASVSNESYASHAYILESKDEKHRLRGMSPVDCDEDDLDSTRIEKSGVLAILTVLRILEGMREISKAMVTIYCDNLEAVSIKRKPRHLLSYVRFNGACYDINEEVLQVIESTRLRILFSHIHGHQDKAKNFICEEADQETRRNIDMDGEAKVFLKNPPKMLRPTHDTPFYSASQVALRIHNSYVVSNKDTHIRLHYHGPSLEQ